MESPLDLYGASREELIAVIVRQRGQMAELQQRLAWQEAELAAQRAAIAQLTERVGALLAALDLPDGDAGSSRPTTMPGLKPTPRDVPAPPEPRPRKRRARGDGRRRMTPTAHQVHAYAQGPHCATTLRGGTVTRTRDVIELIPGRVEVTTHVSVERRCRRCRGRWLPGPEVDGLDVGQGRVGVGLLSLIAVLREELRLPMHRIQWYLDAVHGLSLSVGAIVATLHTLAARAAPRVTQMQATLRASPELRLDETGWRQDGDNGYVWTVSTPTARALRLGWPGAGRAGGADRRRLPQRAGPRLLRRLYGVRGTPPVLLGAPAARRG